jgi:hypothetical protein
VEVDFWTFGILNFLQMNLDWQTKKRICMSSYMRKWFFWAQKEKKSLNRGQKFVLLQMGIKKSVFLRRLQNGAFFYLCN